MLQIRRIALLATVIALAWVPTAALALLPPGPISIITDCGQSGNVIFVVGQTQTFDLTDITIADSKASTEVVAVSGFVNGFPSGAVYEVGANSTFAQKFETPIQFKASSNIPGPVLTCSSSNSAVAVSIQGVMH
jgi:hypothetical protein